MKQESLFEIPVKLSDIVYTDRAVSKGIIKHLQPSGICLDPCRGDGAFYDYLPQDKRYCEVKEGKDFFDFNEKVDWVIGNPPYSIFLEFLEHSFNIANDVSFLVPTNKVFQRQIIMNKISKWGGCRVSSYMEVVQKLASLLAFRWEISTLRRVTRGKRK